MTADKKKEDTTPPTTIITTDDDDKKSKKESKQPTTPPLPPVEAAARRLERLYGGGAATDSKKTVTSSVLPINTTKIIKKWLGSSSGTAGSATLASVAACAEKTLDPSGSTSCATGREILMGLCSEEERLAVGLVVTKKEDGEEDKKGGDATTTTAADTKEAAAMEEDTPSPSSSSGGPDYLSLTCREVESWLITLAVRIYWRQGQFQMAYSLITKGLQILDTHLAESNNASASATVGGLYPLLARMLRYRSLIIESLITSSSSDDDTTTSYAKLCSDTRIELATRHTHAVLRRDADVSATILNLHLRELLLSDRVEQAQKLISNSTFPTELASNNQLLRYLYYSGRVQALRLEYTQSYSNLSQCLRKCPTNTGLGFRIAVQRLLVVVQLLMGEIPDRSVFFGEGMRGELRPYLEIAQAVRRGDLAIFHETVGRHAERLRLDGTYTLISRLAHSVVKAGLRRLKTSYSRISLEDVAARLGLPSATSAEFVVAKAVRDGVIDATIDHEGGFVQSHDLVDVYATVEPSEAFHRRIAYCLTTHNDAVRAMRYTPDAYKKQLEASRGLSRRGKEDKTDEEKAQEIEDELDDEEYEY
jgi:26S proteasome regulatory subunit N3